MAIKKSNGMHTYTDIKKALEYGMSKSNIDGGTGADTVVDVKTMKRPEWFLEVHKGLVWQSIKINECHVCKVTTLICPRCGQMVTWQGCHVDHVVEWRNWLLAWCDDETMLKGQAKVLYNALCNLQIMCGTCNAMKGKFVVKDGMMKGTSRPETCAFSKQSSSNKKPIFDDEKMEF